MGGKTVMANGQAVAFFLFGMLTTPEMYLGR